MSTNTDDKAGKATRIECYQRAYLSDYGFEATLVRYRQRIVVEAILALRPHTIVEVGSGADMLCEKIDDHPGFIERWVIVEPSNQFADIARNAKAHRLHVIEGFLEDSLIEVAAAIGREPDLIICSGLLHEVPDVAELLSAVRSLLGDKSRVHINVPNGNSLHRRLAKAMGLMSDTKEMSKRNIELGQPRVYDMEMLQADVRNARMCVESSGGYFVKPFTHRQMERISDVVTADMLDGLFQLGRELPEIASEIYVTARKAA